MSTAFGDALRERLTLRAVFSWLAALAIFHFFLESTAPQLATTALVTVSAGLTDLLSDAYDLRKSVTHAGFGVQLLLSGVALSVFDDGTVLFPAAFLAVGAWFVLNAIQTVRHEGATVPETNRDGHDVYGEYVAKRIYDILDDRPQTRRELGDSIEADDEVVDAAIDRLMDRDAVTRVRSEFRISPSADSDGLTRLQRRISVVLRRIARPITLEFEGSDGAHVNRDDSRGTTIERRTARSRETDSRTTHDDHGSHEVSSDSNRQREFESAK